MTYLWELDRGSPALPQVRAQIDRELGSAWDHDLRRFCRELLADWRFAEAMLIAEALDRSDGLAESANTPAATSPTTNTTTNTTCGPPPRRRRRAQE